MQRSRTGLAGGFESLISTGKELFGGKLSASPHSILNSVRFRGKLGAAITMITSMTVGFLVIPNNILYLIDDKHGVRGYRSATPDASTRERAEHEYAYIHAGIALIILGCLAMVVSIVLSFFAAKSKRKLDDSGIDHGNREFGKTTRTVYACLIMMNVELFMAIIAGCMELLYRPLIRDEGRLHNMECAIAVFNIIIYAMYVVSMILTCTVLKEKQGAVIADYRRDNAETVIVPNSARDNLVHYSSRSGGGNPYYSQSSTFM